MPRWQYATWNMIDTSDTSERVRSLLAAREPAASSSARAPAAPAVAADRRTRTMRSDLGHLAYRRSDESS